MSFRYHMKKNININTYIHTTLSCKKAIMRAFINVIHTYRHTNITSY